MRTIIAYALLLCAGGLLAWVVQVLGWQRSLGLDAAPPDPALPALVLYGPFRRVRHPCTLALLCAAAAAALRWGGALWWIAGLAGLVLVWSARRDEARSAARFGEAYQRYRHAVPFIVPRLH